MNLCATDWTHDGGRKLKLPLSSVQMDAARDAQVLVTPSRTIAEDQLSPTNGHAVPVCSPTLASCSNQIDRALESLMGAGSVQQNRLQLSA
jgi:hypothetical protein